MPGPAPAWARSRRRGARRPRRRGGRRPQGAAAAAARRARRRARGIAAVEPARDRRRRASPARPPIEGTVLLSNDGVLPLGAATLASIAVIGHNAREARTQGGGSATVLPERVISPLDAHPRRASRRRVSATSSAPSCRRGRRAPARAADQPAHGRAGPARRRSSTPTAPSSSPRTAARPPSSGSAATPPSRAADSLVLHTTYTPDETGDVLLGFAGANPGRAVRRRRARRRRQPVIEGTDLGAAFLNPPSLTAAVESTAGRAARRPRGVHARAAAGSPLDALSARRWASRPTTPTRTGSSPRRRGRRAADVAVVVVGTNSKVESEGYDRENLDLPGRQDDLVRAVAAANPRTIVIVNAGRARRCCRGRTSRRDRARLVRRPGVRPRRSPTSCTGAAEPGGRLPTTWPGRARRRARARRDARRTACSTTTRASTSATARGCKAGTEPAFPFGHGLGYTRLVVGLRRGGRRRRTPSTVTADQHRRPRRQAGRAGLRRARRLRGRAPRALARRLRGRAGRSRARP